MSPHAGPQARASARGRGAQAKLGAARRPAGLADHGQGIATQIQQRSRGEPIADRLVSVSDPDARPIRKGKLGKPNEFGSVAQLAEVTATTGRGARGDVLPAASAPGIRARTAQTLAGLAPTRIFISGRAAPGSRRTRRRLARYRTGCEGRISHLKRGYGLRRSRLRGDQGQRIWTSWAVLAYNLDTLAIHAA